MKIKSLRYDKDVKPFWKRLMTFLRVLFILFMILFFLVRIYAINNVGYKSISSIFGLIYIGIGLVYVIPGVVYLIEPSLFKLNKEQSVQVCDATEAK